MKTYLQFLEGVTPIGYLTRKSSHTDIPIEKNVQTEKTKELRAILKPIILSNPKMREFSFIKPRVTWFNGKLRYVSYMIEYPLALKKLLKSLSCKYPEIGENLHSLYLFYDRNNNKEIPRKLQVESFGHRTHFAAGFPDYLKGCGLGISIYKDFIHMLGYARSMGDASDDANRVWKRLAESNEFYTISTESDILLISKSIIGHEKPFGGKLDDTWLWRSRRLNKYSEDDIYLLIMKFMRNQNINSLQNMVIDTELLIDYPETERKVSNLLKFNIIPEEKEISVKDMLKTNLKDFVKVVLIDGREFILSVLCIIKDDPLKPYIELSNRWMGDKYDYKIDVTTSTLSFRKTKSGTISDTDAKELFRSPIKKIYFLGGKAR